jgi:AraC-like DNA-binding protein
MDPLSDLLRVDAGRGQPSAQGGAKVATIGEEVGYDSEAAFSRAFKKATGLAPGRWREARRTAAS